ncbi:MAG: hypothetical protein ACYC6N_02100 [Pirellulaceae bacterium]
MRPAAIPSPNGISITIFEQGTYAGDALIEGVAAGADRLISYALDLGVEVSPESQAEPQHLVSVRLAKDTLYAMHKQVREQRYVVKNSDDKQRTVLVQYPKDPNWQLVAPNGQATTTRDAYRFNMQLPAGESKILKIRLERTLHQQVALRNANAEAILQYRSARAISDEVKQALSEVVSRKREIERLQNQRQQAQQQMDEITQQQDRIRKNMEQIDRNTELYSRYIKKLTSQEDEIEQLRTRRHEIDQQLQQKRAALDEYLLGLDLP